MNTSVIKRVEDQWYKNVFIKQIDRPKVQSKQHPKIKWRNSGCPFNVCLRKNNKCCHGFRRRSFIHSPNLRRILTFTCYPQTWSCRKRSHRQFNEDIGGRRHCQTDQGENISIFRRISKGNSEVFQFEWIWDKLCIVRWTGHCWWKLVILVSRCIVHWNGIHETTEGISTKSLVRRKINVIRHQQKIGEGNDSVGSETMKIKVISPPERKYSIWIEE